MSNKVALLRWAVTRFDWARGTPPSMKGDDSDSSCFQMTSRRPCFCTETEDKVHERTKASFLFPFFSHELNSPRNFKYVYTFGKKP